MNQNLKLKRRTDLQMRLEWSLLDDIDWSMGVDLSKELLPLNSEMKDFANAHNIPHHSLSWMMGLLAASAISEHERVLNDLKSTWRKSLERLNPSQELMQLGEQFFKEEMKHSEAFGLYLKSAAIFLNLTENELKSFLPLYDASSLSAAVYRTDARMGGSALWWTVAATEEESIELYRMLARNEENTDPLFYQINRLHFEEEVRHSSFSYLMIETFDSSRGWWKNLLSYTLARSIQGYWILKQLARLKHVKHFENRHSILKDISNFTKAFGRLPTHQKLKFFQQQDGYLTMMLNPQSHERIHKQIVKSCSLYQAGGK